jgi:hypothetical protein
MFRLPANDYAAGPRASSCSYSHGEGEEALPEGTVVAPGTQPDTDPGGRVELRIPLRAPRRPGTYRACLKMGWPNGVYYFPSTLPCPVRHVPRNGETL